MPAIDFAIVGLGNPGARYERTRHNIGFMAIDHLLRREKDFTAPAGSKKSRAECWQWDLPEGSRVLLAKPQTYMNRSGLAVKALCAGYGLQPAKVVVIHDELDLALGQARFKYGGGLAGHNGLRSVAAELGTRDFYRIRLGIGRPEPGREVISHVLTSFAPWEQEQLPKVLERTAEGIRILCTRGMQAGMNFLHADVESAHHP
ncbi:aminoacyl-tRNA hydrolase [Desulfovermiculus halophilus]|uniref:aminoacyl-tRNA hydrolase n=1 Tax=Desulfovermiculus halophilus TaxID=339722 RepID=UPI000488B38B|nr:aminoacyl-tRNA hydrolase [Desulfovermiculus halophilus]